MALLSVLMTPFLGAYLWYDLHRPAPQWHLVALAVATLLLFLHTILTEIFQQRGRRLQVLEQGLLDRRPGRHELYRWDEITQIKSCTTSIHHQPTLMLNIWRRDGKHLHLSGSPTLSRLGRRRPAAPRQIGLLELAQAIRRSSYAHRLAAAAARFDAGERIAFGKLALSREGVSHKGALLPWWQVADIGEREETLVVIAAGQERPWAVVSLEDIPNHDLAAGLAEHSQGRRFSVSLPSPSAQVVSALQGRRWRRRLIVATVLLLSGGAGVTLAVARSRFSPQDYLDKGAVFYNSRSYSAAQAEFNTAVAIAPNDPETLIWRGKTYHAQDDYAKALADYDAALKIQPNDPDTLVRRGQIFYDQDNYPQALGVFSQVIAQHPDYPYAYCMRGYTYQKQGLPGRALFDFRACLDRSPREDWGEDAEQQIRRLEGASAKP